MSHTGTLASDSRIYSGVFEQAGVHEVENLREMFELADAIEKQGMFSGKECVVVTNAGGPGVLLTDALEKNGFIVKKLDNKTIEELNKVMPPQWSHNNPIDVIGDAKSDRYKRAFSILEKKKFDIAICVLTPQAMTEEIKTVNYFVNFMKKTGKKCYAVFMGGRRITAATKLLESKGIPCFEEPEILARIIGKLV